MKFNIFAITDLVAGILLTLFLFFPKVFSVFVDPALAAWTGYVFYLILVGGSIGMAVAFVPFALARWLVEWLGIWFLTEAYWSVVKKALVFFVSYIEGILLLICPFPITVPLGYALPYLLNRTSLELIANAMFGAVAKDPYTIFVMAIVATASSYFALFLLKTFNFSFGRIFVRLFVRGWDEAGYEKLLSLAKGEDVDISSIQWRKKPLVV